LDDGIGDTFVSGARREVFLTWIAFQRDVDGEKPNGSSIRKIQSIRRYRRYHRPIARPIQFWLNNYSFMLSGS
jgi:hypothetical protein